MTRSHELQTVASVCTACRGVCVLSLCLLLGCAKSEPQPVAPPAPAMTSDTTPQRKIAEAEPAPPGVDWSKYDSGDIFETSESGPNFEITGVTASGPLSGAAVFVAEPPNPLAVATTFAATEPLKASNNPNAATSKSTSGRVESVLPAGFIKSPEAEVLNGLPTRLRCTVDGSEFALVADGPFIVGTNTGPENARPAMSMLADSFYIGVTEVRVGQYLDAKKRIAAKGILLGDPTNATSPNDHPVLGIQWIDAKHYASSVGCDLPTEAQWEKAARGPIGFASPWGNSRPLWSEPRTTEQIDSVARHPEDRSVFGVYDLAGNALEWTADLYQDDAFKSLSQIPLERRRNWTGPKSASMASQRVVKGAEANWAVTARRGVRMTDKHPQLGFRLVLNIATK